MNQVVQVMIALSCPALRYSAPCQMRCAGKCMRDWTGQPAEVCVIPPQHPVAQVQAALRKQNGQMPPAPAPGGMFVNCQMQNK